MAFSTNENLRNLKSRGLMAFVQICPKLLTFSEARLDPHIFQSISFSQHLPSKVQCFFVSIGWLLIPIKQTLIIWLIHGLWPQFKLLFCLYMLIGGCYVGINVFNLSNGRCCEHAPSLNPPPTHKHTHIAWGENTMKHIIKHKSFFLNISIP